MLQAQSALETARTLFDSGDFTKSLEYIDKVVLVFSPACSKVITSARFCAFLFQNYCHLFLFPLFLTNLNSLSPNPLEMYIKVCPLIHMDCFLQAKLLKVKLLFAERDYSSAISETGFILKEDESNLEALLLRGRAYYYLADHDVAIRFVHLSLLFLGVGKIKYSI